MKNLMLVLVLLVSGIGYSQENPAKSLDRQGTYHMTREDIRNSNEWIVKELDGDSLSQEVFKIFNEYRRYVGVHELVFDTTLQKAADIQSKYCLSIHESTHIQKNNPTMKTPPMRLSSVDPKGVIDFVSEISSKNNHRFTISSKRTLSQYILDLFYFSESHRNIIESSEATKIGIAIYKGGSRFYVVAVFGK